MMGSNMTVHHKTYIQITCALYKKYHKEILLRSRECHLLNSQIFSATVFLNQARAGRRPAHAWFLKVELVRIVSMCVYVCVCVCVSAPEAINN